MRMLAARTKTSLLELGFVLVVAGMAAIAQEEPAPQTPAPPAQPELKQAEPKPPAQKTPEMPADKAVQPAASAALDYLYNRKPQEGTAAKQAADAGQRVQDRTIAVDALGVPRIEDPQTRSRFQRYLALPEIAPAQLNGYSAMYPMRYRYSRAWRESPSKIGKNFSTIVGTARMECSGYSTI